MNTVKVSLIIPVYNVENYLFKCLASAVNQTLKEIEIIIINDGSTDLSINIINKFLEIDKRIIFINQKNQGLSCARNAGIKIARGEYIAFLDSDDSVELTFLEKMYNYSKETNSDIVMCNYFKVNEKTNRLLVAHKNAKDVIYTSEEAVHKIILDLSIQNYAWDKIYKRELFINNNIFYPVGMYFEDMPTTFRLFYYSNQIAYLNEPLYNYLQRENSITKTFSDKHINDVIKALYLMKEFMLDNSIYLKYQKEYRFFCYKNLVLFTQSILTKYKSDTYTIKEAIKYLSNQINILKNDIILKDDKIIAEIEN